MISNTIYQVKEAWKPIWGIEFMIYGEIESSFMLENEMG